MNKAELILKLQSWAAEYADISGDSVTAPPGFWQFLAARIEESGLPGFDQDDIVRAMIGGKLRLIRVQGRQNGMVRYEFAEGAGFGFARVNEIIVEDHQKLANIIDRLEGTAPTL